MSGWTTKLLDGCLARHMAERSFLPYGRQQIDDDDIAAVVETLRGDFLTTGPRVDAFEAALAEKVGAPYAVVCSSGTAALHLACLALGLGQGDIGFVPAITFCATANALSYVGAEPVFADVDPESGLSELDAFAAAYARTKGEKKRAKALLPVHLNGQCAAPEALYEFARDHDLFIIEDGCHSLGAEYRTADGQVHKVGACHHSDMTMFSFHPVKAIASGEGGAITTRDPELYRRLKVLRSHGIERDPSRSIAEEVGSLLAEDVGQPWYSEMQLLGYNYRMSDIHAALGLSQLKKLDRFVETRRLLAEAYDEALRPLAPSIHPVARAKGAVSAFHLYSVQIDFPTLGLTRGELMTRLRALGIGTQVHYTPVPYQPYYSARNRDARYSGADQYYHRQLSLPLHAGMTKDDVDFVVTSLIGSLIPS